jgi:phage-related protein
MIKGKEYIAYSGERFVIEWYFDGKGISDPSEYFENLSEIEQDKIFYLFKRMGDFGKISDITKFNNEGDGVFAFKPQPHRFLSFFVIGKKIIITNAYRKKGDKLPKSEKDLAEKRRTDYLDRVKRGYYYEE